VRTWPLVVLLPLLAAGCTSSSPSAERPRASTPVEAPTQAPERSGPPRLAYVRDRVLHDTDGSLLRIRLGLRGRWGVTSLVAEGDGYLVTDDRWFEGTLGMHRLDGEGQVFASWTSTGPAVTGPRGAAAWVSIVAPESGETGPTLVHTSGRQQDIGPLLAPVLAAYDGRALTFTALRKEGRTYERRGFTTDLVHPPEQVPTPSTRTYAPDGQHWWELRRWRLAIGGPDGEVEIRSRPFVQSFSRPAWEDDSHLLVTVTQRRRQAIGRIDLDGALSLAGDWSPFDNAGFAFVPPG
jgi:hypothetical protein